MGPPQSGGEAVGAPDRELRRAPIVRLLDARDERLDEAGLRARAVEQCRGPGRTSRSYRHPLALVALHDGPVGVDIERVGELDARFAAAVCTQAERGRYAAGGLPAGWLSDLWCSKEALAKALGDALRYDPARLDAPLDWPDGRAGPWRARRLQVPEGHVGWVCWRS
jgi:hypothetical protein